MALGLGSGFHIGAIESDTSSENSSCIARVTDATGEAEVAAETDSVTATPTSYDEVLASSVPSMVMTVSLAYSSGG